MEGHNKDTCRGITREGKKREMKKRQSGVRNWSGEEATLRSNKLLEGSDMYILESFQSECPDLLLSTCNTAVSQEERRRIQRHGPRQSINQ